MTSGKVEQLESRLREAQGSLTVALARIEAYRCRERLLLRDYDQIRKRARELGIQLTGARAQQSATETPPVLTSLEQAAADQDSSLHDEPPTHLCLTALDETHPLWLQTRRGKVPGTLHVVADDLHFVQTHAKISAADYLGIRSVKASADDGHLPHSSSNAALADDTSGRASPQPGSSKGGSNGGGGGVLSGAASWLAQRVRTSGSGSGGEADNASTGSGGIGFTSMMTTIMHSLEDPDDSEQEAEEGGLQPEAGPPSWDPGAASSQRWRTPALGPEAQTWDIAWADAAGQMQRLQFEAMPAARAFIAKQVQQWSAAATASATSTAPNPPLSQTAFDGAQPVRLCSSCMSPVSLKSLPVTASPDGRLLRARVFSALDLEIAAPDHMRPDELPPLMSDRSGILHVEQARALAGTLPARFRMNSWSLLYSTEKHGISLQTLYRRSVNAPTLLVVRDAAGFVFGAFTTEGWHVATRFYGTGETFVFQLQPHRAVWRWRPASSEERNDYFMFGTPESLAVGGGGHFAIFLSEGLLRGSSGISSTFGNPCLAGSSDFTVGQLEVWSLTPP